MCVLPDMQACQAAVRTLQFTKKGTVNKMADNSKPGGCFYVKHIDRLNFNVITSKADANLEFVTLVCQECIVATRWPLPTTRCIHGACKDLGDTFACSCSKGWTGTTCLKDLDDCTKKPCTEFGKCVDTGPAEYKCECEEGWGGKHCEKSESGKVITTTTSTTTSSTSTTTTTTTTTSTTSTSTTTTSTTTTSTSTTTTSTLPPWKIISGKEKRCENADFCVIDSKKLCDQAAFELQIPDIIAGNQKKDTKPRGCYLTRGKQLQFNILTSKADALEDETLVCQPCPPSRCDNKPCKFGSCHNVGKPHPEKGYLLYRCECLSGYDGKDCDNDIDDCKKKPCTARGTCSDDGPNKFACKCQEGWGGKTCADDVFDNCQKRPCKNGFCADTGDAYKCTCGKGWKGSNCAEDVDDCASKPCQGGHGTCKDLGNIKFTCECKKGWGGQFCKKDTLDHCTLDFKPPKAPPITYHKQEKGGTCKEVHI